MRHESPGGERRIGAGAGAGAGVPPFLCKHDQHIFP